MIIDCRFFYLSTKYICHVKAQEIPSTENKLEFNGQHMSINCNDDVKGLHFSNCIMLAIPQNIGDTFKNIEDVIITSKLKFITKFSLKSFKNLKKLDLSENDLEFLPGDLFKFTKNIENVSFVRNELNLLDLNYSTTFQI